MSGRCNPLSDKVQLFVTPAIAHSYALLAKNPSDHLNLLIHNLSRNSFNKWQLASVCFKIKNCILLKKTYNSNWYASDLLIKIDIVGKSMLEQSFAQEGTVHYLIICLGQLKNKFHDYYIKLISKYAP